MITVGTIAVSSILFYGLLRLLKRTGWSDMPRRAATVVLWLMIASLICWVLFEKADAAASLTHQRNVGMALVYFYVWLLAVIAAPIYVFAMTRISPWRDR